MRKKSLIHGMALFIVLILCVSSVFMACGKKKPADVEDPSKWPGKTYAVQDLGGMSFDAFADDYCYDWGFTTLYEQGVYKTWWVRPSLYDAIFYAESTDLKHWTNVERVLTLSPSSDALTRYDFMKGMFGRPSVVHVGDTYYMYFEAPASEDPDTSATVLEWDNNVMLATSKDGKKWEFHGENGQPKPVIAMPSEMMGNIAEKHYGVGQPSAFYKDGLFYVYYCYVIGSTHEIRVATSSDGINFGETSTHTSIGLSNGAGVKYNAKTNKYQLVLLYMDDLYIMESSDPMKWPTKDVSELKNKANKITNNTTRQYSFPDFVTDEKGQIQSETFFVTYTDGKKSSTSDWRAEHMTWDGHIAAVNPKEFTNKIMVLPNGKKVSEATLSEYQDIGFKYNLPDANAVYVPQGTSIMVDCAKDSIYNKATKIEVGRAVYGHGSNLTNTYGEAWVAWDEKNMYVYIEVHDDVLSWSNNVLNETQFYRRDSVDIFVDIPNDHTTTDCKYGFDQYMIDVGANNEDFAIKGVDEQLMTDEFTSEGQVVKHRAKQVDFGYIVELQIPWYKYLLDSIQAGKVIGLDIQINDDMGSGNREAMKVWSDHKGNSFRYTDRFGELYL